MKKLLAAGAFAAMAAMALPATASEELSLGDLYRMANEAYEGGDHIRFRALMKSLVAARPYHPTLRLNLARAYALNGEIAESIGVFSDLAEEGLVVDFDAEGDFATLASHPRYEEIARRFDANAAPRGDSSVAISTDITAALPEGVAFDEASETFYLGTVRTGEIFKIDAEGNFSRFASSTDLSALYGVYGMSIDSERRLLWAATNSAAPFTGDKPAEASIARAIAFDLDTGEVRRILDAPAGDAPRLIGDVIPAPDGAVYASDSLANVIYRAQPFDDALSVFHANDAFANLQGLTLNERADALFIADYHMGVFRLELNAGASALMTHPPGVNPSGVDGLYYYDGDLIALQNGVTPHRIMRFRLSDDRSLIKSAHTLAANLADWDEPTLGAIVGETLYYNAFGQWSAYDSAGAVRDGVALLPAALMELNLER